MGCLSQTQKGVEVWTCHLQQGAPYPQAGPQGGEWHSPTIFMAHLPTPLPTSPRSLVRIRSFWFFEGLGPGVNAAASPRFARVVLGRLYLLCPSSKEPGVFGSKEGNMSPSPPQEGRLMPGL